MKWLLAITLGLSVTACATDFGQPKAAPHVIFELGGPSSAADKLAQTVEIVLRRLGSAAINDFVVRKQGDNRFQVDMPGARSDAIEKMIHLVTQPGALSFNLVDDTANSDAFSTSVPSNGRIALRDQSADGNQLVVMVDPAITGTSLASAKAIYDTFNRPAVSFAFSEAGKQAFAEMTRGNIGERFAIVLDGAVITAPVIRTPIYDGTGLITGAFTFDEAQRLATILQTGALPAELRIVEIAAGSNGK